MKGRKYVHKHFEIICMVFLLSVLAATALVTILIGVEVYQKVASQIEHHAVDRTAFAYIDTKVSQHDRWGDIEITYEENQSVLILKEAIEGSIYETRIYSYDGNLYELFTEAGIEASLADGMCLIEQCELNFEKVNDQIINVILKGSEGHQRQHFVPIHSRGIKKEH